MTEINGSCLCGSLTYHADSDALFAGVCHCKACQKSTGSAFSVVIGVKKTDFTITGESLKTYERIGDSGKRTYRHFCSTCGSTVAAEMELKPGLVCIKAGTLDNQWLQPQFHVYWKDHQEWIEQLGDLARHHTTLQT